MKKLNTKNPFYAGGNKSKPQKVIFSCDCDTLRMAKNLRAEINFRIREIGYEKQDFKCEIKKMEEEDGGKMAR